MAAAAADPLQLSVIIPALNESRRIASVVASALADPVTAEVVVSPDPSPKIRKITPDPGSRSATADIHSPKTGSSSGSTGGEKIKI